MLCSEWNCRPLKRGEDDYPIMVRLADEYRYNADALMDQKITFRDQTNGQIQQVPISAVASRAKSATFSAVKRKNMKRLITVSSNVLETYNPNEVVAEIKEALVDYDLPQENGIKFTGQQEQQAKEMAFLSNALMIAVFFNLPNHGEPVQTLQPSLSSSLVLLCFSLIGGIPLDSLPSKWILL